MTGRAPAFVLAIVLKRKLSNRVINIGTKTGCENSRLRASKGTSRNDEKVGTQSYNRNERHLERRTPPDGLVNLVHIMKNEMHSKDKGHCSLTCGRLNPGGRTKKSV